MKYQVVERDPGADWHVVRYADASIRTFDVESDAYTVAVEYLTQENVNNALAASEKQASAEYFMPTEEGILLGVLDNALWYMTMPNGDRNIDPTFLNGKTEVGVRPVPGT